MTRPLANPVVHLELRTDDLPGAGAFYTRLFDWRVETVHAGSRAYRALVLAEGIGGGLVEREGAPPSWLPYVEVADVDEVTARGRFLGAAVTVEPREGPAGWWSVLSVPAGAEIALWQPKT